MLRAEYLDAVLGGMWEDGEKMDDAEVFLARLNRSGLDGQRLLDLSGSADVKAELVANTEAAVARGVFGIPTFFVGDEMFFGKERIGQIEELLINARSARQFLNCIHHPE